jgi:hypothetical protein
MHFPNFIPIFNLSVVDDVRINSEAPVGTSSILKICWLSLSEVLLEVGLCAYVRRGDVCVRVCEHQY